MSLATSGSPPQVRGKQRTNGDAGFIHRITPAGAGKTRAYGSYRCRAGDPPRRCGENTVYSRNKPAPCGSPPQVRGKPESAENFVRRLRITPAGAGKTCAFGGVDAA